MAEITKSQTTADLLKKVGSKLDIDITDTSTPNRAQVISWLNDAALLLVRMLPEDRLGLLRDSFEEESTSSGLVIDRPYMRIVSVKKFGVTCTRLSQNELELVASRTPLMHTTRNPAYCVSGSGGDVEIQFWPETPGPVLVKAIRKPEAYEDDDTWEPGDYTLPAELELHAVDYAVLQGKIQDEEIQQVQMLMQLWMQFAGIEGQIEGLGVRS
jgi:hypothetical protein